MMNKIGGIWNIEPNFTIPKIRSFQVRRINARTCCWMDTGTNLVSTSAVSSSRINSGENFPVIFRLITKATVVAFTITHSKAKQKTTKLCACTQWGKCRPVDFFENCQNRPKMPINGQKPTFLDSFWLFSPENMQYPPKSAIYIASLGENGHFQPFSPIFP